MTKKTVLLTKADVMKLVDPKKIIPILRNAFKNYSQDKSIPAQRVPSKLPAEGAAMVLIPGLDSEIPAYTVKVNAKYPNEKPAIKGLIILHDLNSGSVLSVMDSSFLTAVRTGLGSALATHELANKSADRVAIIGAGVQGEFQLRYLSMLRKIKEVNVYDVIPDNAEKFSQKMSKELGPKINCFSNAKNCLKDTEIIMTATWATKPFIFYDMVIPGAHITTIGPDQPGKCEVDAELIKKSLFICDDRDLAVKMGAIGGAGLCGDSIHAEIGEIISGDKKGRTSENQITIYGAVGLPFQDLVASWQVYNSAIQKEQGILLNFLE